MAEYINETIRVIEERTSVRALLPGSVTPEETAVIESAALRAPNGGKMSKFSLIRVEDPELKKFVAKSCDNQPFIADAPLVYIVLADFNRWFRAFLKHVPSAGAEINYPHEDEILLSEIDAMLAAENMVIAAESMGIHSCFIADIICNYREVKRVFHLPKYVMPITLLIMGRAKQEPSGRSARIDAPVVFKDRYEELPEDQFEKMVNPMIARDKNGDPVMSDEEYIRRYYVRRLGSWLSFERTNNVREMFEDWLSSPYERMK